MSPWFIATQRFDPSCGERWTKYLAWSGLVQLDEVATLDSMLCARVLGDMRDEYWPHVVNEDFMLDYFTDLDFMLKQLPADLDWPSTNLLCVFRNPLADPLLGQIPFRASFLGYDLCDTTGGPSALSNCGGFPLAFDGTELNRHGLLDAHARAVDVRSRLKERYPGEPHADCHVWAIFRRIES